MKQDVDCPTINSNTSAPNKDDLVRAYLATKTVGGDVYLNLAWVRVAQNSKTASAHVGFEFNQGRSGSCAGSSLVKRTAGDMLIVYDFTGGSGTAISPTLTLRRWITSGTCDISSDSAPCWGPTTTLSTTNSEGATYNGTTTISDAIAPSETDVGQVEFGEAGINLTEAGVFSNSTCSSFGQVEVISRSSGNSGQAAMEDLVGPGEFTVSNCGTVVVKKVTKNTSGDVITSDATQFTFSTNVQTLPGPAGVSNFSLSGQPAGTPSDTKTISNVQPNTGRTVTELAPASPYTLVGLECTGGSSRSTDLTTRTATFDIAADQTVTCTFTNQRQKVASAMDTTPWIYPNDKATVTSSGATGSVTFKLYGATTDPSKTALENCEANGATGRLYTESVNLPTSAPLTVNTSNTTVKVASSAKVYWRVEYGGNSDYFGRLSDCTESIDTTLTTDSGGSAP